MKLAAVFPGQGSQSVGMLKALSERFDAVGETFAQGSEVLGYDVWKLVQEGPEDTLKQTEYTQPVMFASGVAVWRCWQAAGGPLPTVLAGHSLGEYSALTAAGVFAYEDAMGLVAERARLMGNAVPAGVGGMAAIMGLDDESVAAVCADIHGERVVQAVNFNAPGQVVISGHLDAVEQATKAAKAKGARRAMVLPVSVPNHSALMDVAAEPLAARIASTPVTPADMRVIQNLEACSYDTLEDMLGALKRHVNNPVYWTGSVQAMKAAGVELVVELGPGKVLTGLTKRIDKSLTGVCVQDPDSLDHAISLATAEHS